MGDDLLDDYWVEEVVAEEADDAAQQQQQQQQQNVITEDKPKKKKAKKKKEKTITSENNEPTDTAKDIAQVEDQKEVKKSKKKLKRKSENIVTTTEAEIPATKKKKKKKKPGKGMEEYEPTLEDMWKFFETELAKTLSDIEVNDIKPTTDEWFLKESQPINRDSITNFPTYLKNIVPTWSEDCEGLTKSGSKGSPVMLIVTSSAVRAVELLRSTNPFKGENCKTAKLFAKHFKLDEQSKNLREKVSHLAVGTPHRVVQLIENGSLKLNMLKTVVVDWSWKDVKMRGVTNMPMVKEQFVNLFQHHLFDRCRKGKLSVGLF